MKSRRREATVIAHCSSDNPKGQWHSSSGFSLVWRPWPRMIARPPTASVTAMCSPFGSPVILDAPAERQRSCMEALGQGGLARAHDSGEHDIGCGDDAACVEHPGVVDEQAARVGLGRRTPRRRRGRLRPRTDTPPPTWRRCSDGVGAGTWSRDASSITRMSLIPATRWGWGEALPQRQRGAGTLDR